MHAENFTWLSLATCDAGKQEATGGRGTVPLTKTTGEEGCMQWALFDGLAPQSVDRILASARRIRLPRGGVLFREGDQAESVCLVESGKVAVRISTPEGALVTVAVLGPGSAVGELALVGDDQHRTATVQALEPVVALTLFRRDFAELRRQHPSVTEFLVRSLAATVRRLDAQLVEAFHLPAEVRIRRRLHALAQVYDRGSRVIEVDLTQEELAQLAGTTRPTLNRVLREEERRGTLRLARGRIVILDRAQLETEP
jgi:CRP/FNR family transcriptional regulator, cyclic AMP receptor protein